MTTPLLMSQTHSTGKPCALLVQAPRRFKYDEIPGNSPQKLRHIMAAPCPYVLGVAYQGKHNCAKDKAMTAFDEREHAFEAKFAHDEDMKFKAEARGNRLLGLWAAELLGKTGDDADAYAIEVVKSDFEEAGHEDVVRKLAADLGDIADPETIRAKMAELRIVAKAQMMTES